MDDIKAVFFDLDNTLIDFMTMKKKASYEAAKAMVKAGLRTDVKKAQKELFKFYLENGIESGDAFQKFLKKNLAYDERILAAGLNAYLKTKYLNLKPYKDAKKVLAALKKKGLRLAIVTDAPRLKAFMRLDAIGIVKYFDVVVGYEDTNRKKPSRLPFRKALKELNLKASECLMVGDWPEHDIIGAGNVGLQTCFARYGGQSLGKIKADYIIDDIKDLLKVI